MKKGPLEFWKVEAAGNDFILYFRKVPSRKELKKEVIEACRPHVGIGADGVVYTWFEGNSWNWAFFNADASETGLCGNAARALALWIEAEGQARLPKSSRSKTIEWKGKLGLFRARRHKGRRPGFEVNWSIGQSDSRPIHDELRDLLWQLNERGLAGTYLYNVGVPHLVLLGYAAWNDTDRATCNAVFRSHPSLGIDGANITWVELETMKTVSFERGVERETLACGSGALAAFLALRAYNEERGATLSDANFQFPGGALRVHWSEESGIWLGGPARIVFHGVASGL